MLPWTLTLSTQHDVTQASTYDLTSNVSPPRQIIVQTNSTLNILHHDYVTGTRVMEELSSSGLV